MKDFDIKSILPHRDPFLLVDRILRAGDDSLEAEKDIGIHDGVFSGHFPGNPIFPGVLMIEAMAQAAGLLAYLNARREPGSQDRGYRGYLAGVDKARFLGLVRPGCVLKLKAALQVRALGNWRFECSAEALGEMVAKAVISLHILEGGNELIPGGGHG
jgi:3-hydroxyacyl-[acyl-carrier-protein] dehydratase